MAKPIRLELRWNKLEEWWETRETRRGSRLPYEIYPGATKKQAIREAAMYARQVHADEEVGVVLRICNLDGRYSEERSYGADNPRRPG